MKKVCIVTASRAEYGLLRWVIDGVYKSPDLELQLVVTGAHLDESQGLTYKYIVQDGYPIAAKLNMKLGSGTGVEIIRSMAICQDQIALAFEQLAPDMVLVLGDRYELLPICSAALVLRIPIAHIAGGDVTEGAIDDKVRNAVTMLSTYHFPGTEESGSRIARMIGSDKSVFVVGETNIDNLLHANVESRSDLANALKIDPEKKWVCCTYHPETTISQDINLKRVKDLCRFFSLEIKEYEVIITGANADVGGDGINHIFEQAASQVSNIHFYLSLGASKYVNLMRYADFMIGNSSSGIFESPFMQLPCINIGSRQKGRHCAENIVNVDGSYRSLLDAFRMIVKADFRRKIDLIVNSYGDGHASERIVNTLRKFLYD